MPLPLSEEKFFYSYISLIFLTFFCLLANLLDGIFLGFITILWGLLGFYRYIFLTDNNYKNIPNILTLPSRILFGLNQEKEKNINLIFLRFHSFDIFFFFFGVLFFFVWMIYCSLYPAEISIMADFLKDNHSVLSMVNHDYFQMHIILRKISILFLVLLIIFNALTFFKADVIQKRFQIVYLPLIFMMFLYIILSVPFSSAFSEMDYTYLKGMGWGQFFIFEALLQGKIQTIDSYFLRRYVEGGQVAAYGLYCLTLPLLWAFMRDISVTKHYMKFILAALCIVLLGALDILWAPHNAVLGLQLILLSYLAYMWGACRVAP